MNFIGFRKKCFCGLERFLCSQCFSPCHSDSTAAVTDRRDKLQVLYCCLWQTHIQNFYFCLEKVLGKTVFHVKYLVLIRKVLSVVAILIWTSWFLVLRMVIQNKVLLWAPLGSCHSSAFKWLYRM